MGWESFRVVRFDLGPLLKVKRGCKPTYRKSWAGNILMSDLTFGPSFKFKRWFTCFGELSFRWIQICIGSAMRRSSFLFPVQLNRVPLDS